MTKNDIIYKLKVIDEASKYIKEISDKYDELNKEQKKVSETTTNKLNPSMKKTSALMKGVYAAAVVFITTKVIRFGKVLLNLYNTQEMADIKLKASLQLQTKNYKNLFVVLKDYAGQLQKTSIYGDELIESVMQMGLSMGLSADNIKEATKVAIDLAGALGMDLQTAMRYVAQAGQGNVNMLARYIPALRKLNKENMNASEIISFLGKQVDGFGKKMATTTAGKIQQMKNAIGDLGEVLGGTFAPLIGKIAEGTTKFLQDFIPKLSNFFKNFKTIMGYLGDSIGNYFKYIGIVFVETFKNIMNWFIQVGQILWKPLEYGFQYMIAGIKKIFVNTINFIIEHLNFVVNKINILWRKVFKKDLLNQMGKVEIDIDFPENTIAEDIKKIQEDYLNKVNKSNERMIKAYSKIGQPIEEIRKILSRSGSVLQVATSNAPIANSNIGRNQRTMNLGINYNELSFLDKVKIGFINLLNQFGKFNFIVNNLGKSFFDLIQQSKVYQIVMGIINNTLLPFVDKILLPLAVAIMPVINPLLEVFGKALDFIVKYAIAPVGAMFMWLTDKIKALGQTIWYIVSLQWGKLGNVKWGGNLNSYYQQILGTTVSDFEAKYGIKNTTTAGISTTGVGASYESGRSINITFNKESVVINTDVIAGDMKELAQTIWENIQDVIELNLGGSL